MALRAAFTAEDANNLIGAGWGGRPVFVLDHRAPRIAMGPKGRVPGILRILCASGGAFLGGNIVAVFMVLALMGGILATIGVKKPAKAVTA